MTSFTRRQALIGLAGISIAATAAACSSSSPSAGSSSGAEASGEVSYWLWDSNQQPVYQQVADAFHAANPNITVKITQYSWDDYWTNVTNGFVASTAPDVFTNHLSKYPEFVTQGQLVALDDQLKKDGVKTDIYQKGLADLWVGKDGKRYGLPKDFDTVSIFYNKDLIKAASVNEADLATLTWNPTDGGTYEKMIAHLTVDANGKRGDEAGFDKTKVKVYGLGLDGGSGGGNGQTQWSMYTGTTGWTFTDKNPWGKHYNYDKPEFQNTMAWMRSLIEKGYMPSIESITGQSSADIFGAGKYAMITNGSWMINQMFGYKGINTGLAPVPIGPNGKRSSMYNGLADSVWIGSKNQPAAIKWVEFLGSAAAQDIVGKSGVVFPAIPSGTDLAGQAFGAKTIDVNSSFLVHIKDGTTFLFPITDNASQVTGIMQPAVDAVFTGKAKADSLTAANTQVNALFG
jgi:multiple sugar transport system substrate-binding protein